MRLFLDDSVTQRVFTYQYKPKWLHRIEKSKGRRSFDFADLVNKIIIEIDGDQHFFNKVHWGSTGAENCERDIEKIILSVKNGFSGCRLYQPDVLYDKVDWAKWLAQALDYISLQSEPVWVFPKNTQYERHIECCKANSIQYHVI
jgi:hypothetical protein